MSSNPDARKRIISAAYALVAAHARDETSSDVDQAYNGLITAVADVARIDVKSDSVLRFGELTIDGQTRRLRYGDHDIALSHLEFELLNYLANRATRVFTREQLLDAVWGRSRYVIDRSVDVYVRRIRQKLKLAGAPSCIHTIRGTGYVFDMAGKPIV